MASGEDVVRIVSKLPPGTLYAQADVRAGGSTPTEQIDMDDFDADTTEYLDFKCRLKGYAGGGLTFTLPWSASSANTAETRWGIAIRRIQDDAEDIDASHSYVFNEVDDTAPSVSGEVSYPTIAFTDGADMDSWAEGELAIVRVRRNASHANDDMSGDAELWALFGKET